MRENINDVPEYEGQVVFKGDFGNRCGLFERFTNLLGQNNE